MKNRIKPRPEDFGWEVAMTYRMVCVLLCVLVLLLGACSDGDNQPDGDLPDGDVDGDLGDGDLPDGDLPDGDVDGDADADEDADADPDEDIAPVACDTDDDCLSLGMICTDWVCDPGEGQAAFFYLGDDALPVLRYRNARAELDILRRDGSERVFVMQGASARAWLDAPDESGVLLDLRDYATREVTTATETDELGEAQRLIVMASADDKPGLRWTVSLYENGAGGADFVTARMELLNTTDAQVLLAKMAPLYTSAAHGGSLMLDAAPPYQRILENGSYTYLDFMVGLSPGDVARDEFYASGVPGNFEGHSVANWNHSVVDMTTQRAWVAGALSFESSSPVFNLSYDPDTDTGDAYSYFSAEAAYLPRGKLVDAGDEFGSETMYVSPWNLPDEVPGQQVFGKLEAYALAMKAFNKIQLWHERDPDNRIPNGWNSWSGSGSTGGYGTDINEELILSNLDFMATEFRDWGIDWFQVDDGYQYTYGDWRWNETRFPHGARWLSDQIRARGLKPGLWMSPLALHDDAPILAEHPDWIADKTSLGTLFSADYTLLDLTNPEVQAWVRELFRTFREDWNFDWLKMDFSYHALFADNYMDPYKTREEMYRGIGRIIREEITNDTFFLAVSALGAHYGVADADRLTLDLLPAWDWDPAVSKENIANQQGIKPTVRTVARRYFLHNRVWINHPDLIIFRSNTREENWPRVTFEEARCFCTFVGLSGGIVKIGDRLQEMTGEQVNAVRKLLPIYPNGARPLDLFKREFPEVMHLVVDGGLAGYEERFDVVGLFNWGWNIDLTTNPYTEIADDGEPLVFALRPAELDPNAEGTYLAYEFWDGVFLGEVAADGALDVSVPSHDSRAVALRKLQSVPQFLGWNRQITMGGTLLHATGWDAASKTLTVPFKAAAGTELAPFVWQIAVFAPTGFTPGEPSFSGVAVTDATLASEVSDSGQVLTLSFTPTETGELTVTIPFE